MRETRLQATDVEVCDGEEVVEVHSSRGWFVRITDPDDFDPDDRWTERPKIEFMNPPEKSEIYFCNVGGEPYKSHRHTA